MKRFLQFSAAILCLAASAVLWMVGTEAASTLRKVGTTADALATIPAMASYRLAGLQASLDALPGKVLPPVLERVDTATAKLDGQVTVTRGELLARVDTIERDANARTGEALALVRTAAAGVPPVLAGATSVLQDVQGWLEYDALVGLVDSATVATTSAAQASEAIRDATPKLVQSAVSVGQSVDGIAQAAKREADELTKPQTLRQKIAAWLGIIPRIVRVVL